MKLFRNEFLRNDTHTPKIEIIINLLREYKNLYSKVRSIKFFIKSKPWRVDGKGIAYIRCTNYRFL